MQDDELFELIDRLVQLPARNGRRILAVVGPPGSGKSTVSEALAQSVKSKGLSCGIAPMDGFHYDDAVLEARGLRPRKGAPETFDVAGLLSLLSRLRKNDEQEIAIPVFDRSLEISRNAARVITQSTELLIVEGNYLLLDRPGWRDLAEMFDLSVALAVDERELHRRLTQRWHELGLPEDEIETQVESNDLPNGLSALKESTAAAVRLNCSQYTRKISN